tara:strand:- start:31 stop:3201 length:3171 start_codon:yes stop_codon:yes gene_type:complete
MKIEEFDTSKPKNRQRIRALQRRCEISISEFPRSSNFQEIIKTCEILGQGNHPTPEQIGRSSEQGVKHVLHTLRTLGIIDRENKPGELLNLVVDQSTPSMKMAELSVMVSRSEWLKNWMKWEGITSLMDMKNQKSSSFVNSVSYGAKSTITATASHMNSLVRQAIENHPSRNSELHPDALPWDQLRRVEHHSESIFEKEKIIPAIKRVARDARFVRLAQGYVSIMGYDLVARNLTQSEVRMIVGSNDTRGRMQIANAATSLRESLENGPLTKMKIESAKMMRNELMNGSLRVRCLKARHTPNFHAKVQIYDRSVVLSGSMNLSYNGLVKNIENCEVVVADERVRYYIENFDDIFREATEIEDELLEVLDESWALKSDDLVEPKDAFLRVLLEMYGDSDEETGLDGISLADYQEYSVNKSLRDLHEHRGSLLVAPTGTGKTIMGTLVARRMHQRNKIGRVFVVAPNPQILNIWEREFLKFRIPFSGIRLSNFREQTGNWEEKLRQLKQSINPADLIIVDECHHLRNDGNGRKNLLDLLGEPGSGTAYRLLLTATPMSKELNDLNNLLTFTHPSANARKPSEVGLLPSLTYLTHPLIARHFAKESPSGHRYVEFSGEERFFAEKRTEQLNYDSRQLDKLVDILTSMPLEVVNHTKPGQLTLDGSDGRHAGNGQELVRVHLSRSFESSPAQGISAIEKMIENNLESTYFHSQNLREKLESAKLILKDQHNYDSKLNACLGYIAPSINRGERVLLFCEYKATVSYLKEKLFEEFGVVIETLTGDDNLKKKESVCERFSPEFRNLRKRKDDPQILIATDCLSEGVDLPDANLMVNYDLFWTPLKLVQRVGRLDRPTNKKRSFGVANLIPSGPSYDNLFRLCTRLGERSTVYKKMAGIDVFKDNVRDLDNLGEEELDHLRAMHGDNPDLAFENFEDQFATKVLALLARATDEDKRRALDLPLGATTNYKSSNGIIGILSVVRDQDGYPHVLSNHYADNWNGKRVDAEDQEESIGQGRPHSDAIPLPVPNSFYTEHEVMLSRLTKEYRCEIEDLTPVVNLVRS